MTLKTKEALDTEAARKRAMESFDSAASEIGMGTEHFKKTKIEPGEQPEVSPEVSPEASSGSKDDGSKGVVDEQMQTMETLKKDPKKVLS